MGLLAAGCADSGRFTSNEARPQGEVTGSITQPAPPAPSKHVVAQPLPAPVAARPATVAPPGIATGAGDLHAYRPATRNTDITGSVPAPAGHWTWDGGAAVVVAPGQTLEQIAHKYGVPAAAIMQVNKLASPTAIRPGQHLVIPRYVSTNAAPAAPVPAPNARSAETVHVVAPGETLMMIARKHGVTLSALAHANKISAFGKISIGDRLTIPGGGKRVVADARAPAPKVAQPVIAPVPAAPAENVRLAKPEAEPTAERNNAVKTAEPAGTMPSFRWPLKGRITSAFGPRPDGTRNDGIDLAVPAGTPIKASDDGVVAYSGDELKGYGNLVLIRHANGYVSAYANASELLVKRGDTVKRGQVIARAGQTGNATAPQLHFEIRKGPVPVDPTKFLGGT